MTIMTVYNKTTLGAEHVIKCQYKAEDIITIKHYTYGEMCDMGMGEDLNDYEKTEVFMQLAIRKPHGECAYATFPTSRWDIEFEDDAPRCQNPDRDCGDCPFNLDCKVKIAGR